MSKRILVIEDQEDNRRILRYLLGSVQYEVIEALTGEESASRTFWSSPQECPHARSGTSPS